MARKNANSSPGVWLGLLLVLVAHTLALNTHLEEAPDYKRSPKNYDDNSSGEQWRGLEEEPKTIGDDAEYLYDGQINENSAKSNEFSDKGHDSLEGNLKRTTTEGIPTTVKTQPDHSTPQHEAIEIETVAAPENRTKIEQSPSRKEHEIEGKLSSTRPSHHEFDSTEEEDNFEESTNSEFAEATTPSSKLLVQSDGHDAGDKDIVSLAKDTTVNYRQNSKNYAKKSEENDTNISISNNGENLGHEPKNEVEIFNSTLTTILSRSEAGDDTTPYFTSTSKPKGRTILIASDNDSSTKKPRNFSHSEIDQSTSDTIMRIVPKKSGSTEKSTETKPYPYHKLETKFTDHELVSENQTNTEESTEEISAYENTIGRKKSSQKIVVTQPSVLVENSIQQFKPIHSKRSGNSSRVNSTLDTPSTSTAWTLPITVELAAKNATEVSEGSQTILLGNGNRSQINNDVPQDNPNKSVTTERSPVILSEVTENNIETPIGKINGTYNLTASTPVSTKLTERFEVTAEDTAEDYSKLAETQVSNSTEEIGTVPIHSSTSNEIQMETEHSNTTHKQLDVTESPTEHPISQGNFSTTTEIYIRASTPNRTEKSILEMETTVASPITISTSTESIQESSSGMPASESVGTKPSEENVANVTRLETIPESRGSTRSITESTTSQTTNIEYEFVELTTPQASSTVSHGDVSISEKINTTTDFLNETSTQTTESQETVITDSSIEENGTTFSRNIETVNTETPALSTTPTSETTTTSEIDDEVTTNEDLSNGTNSPVSENSFTTETEVYSDTTPSPTSFNDNTQFHGRAEVTTTGLSYDPEEMTTTIFTETVPPTEEATTISNIEVIVSSESTSTSQSFTTVTQSTTLRIQSTTELPEFTISSDDVTLFVRVIVAGSWNEVCPLLSNLRQSLASLLTAGTNRTVLSRNIILHQTQCSIESTPSTTLTPVVLYVVDDNGHFDYTMTEMLPRLYEKSTIVFPLAIHSVEKLMQTEPSNNAIAVVAVSCVAFICLVLLAGLLFIMRKRQTRFNYGERCRPVSLDAFRVDSVSAYNSVRRKGLTRASKRSYGNPAFEDSSVTPSHPLNFAGLSSFCNESNAITEEFEGIPQVTARMDELPAGAEVKNRYANVAPLPETRVLLQKINNEPLTEYINASYVRGPKNATKYYIACQAPMESTVSDFWRMIWEQQSKVIIMLTDIIENGVEKCVEYIPPSEVTDCHRLYGDYQVTLKKREAKEKYAISTLHLKNLENNTFREVSHIWYLWPTNGVPSNGTGLIAILLEARALQRGAPAPIVVHCSPGTGRTGTLIALDLGIRQYEITRTVDVPRVVYTIRRDRAGAVQTKEQYAFIYKALNLYAAKLAGGALESM